MIVEQQTPTNINEYPTEKLNGKSKDFSEPSADGAALARLINSDKTKPPTLDLSTENQQRLLGALVTDQALWDECGSLIKREHWPDKARGAIFSAVSRLHARYGQLMCRDILTDEIIKAVKDDPARAYYEVELDAVLDPVLATRPLADGERQYFADQLREFAKRQALKAGGSEMLAHLERGHYDKAKAAIDKAFAIGADDRKQTWCWYQDLKHEPDAAWLVEPLILDKSLVCLFGPSDQGKSFLTLNLGLALATGTPFLGKYPLTQSSVAYFTCEGKHGLKKRLHAFEKHYKAELSGERFFLCRNQYAVNQPKDVDAMSRMIDQSKVAPRIIFIDTVNRFLLGSENDPKDMGGFIQGATKLKERHDCTLAVVHHTGWQNQERERAHSSLRGACDNMYSLLNETLELAKCKDVPFFKMQLGKHDVEGTGSCVYLPTNEDVDKSEMEQFLELFPKDRFVALADISYTCSQATAYRWVSKLLADGKLHPAENKRGKLYQAV